MKTFFFIFVSMIVLLLTCSRGEVSPKQENKFEASDLDVDFSAGSEFAGAVLKKLEQIRNFSKSIREASGPVHEPSVSANVNSNQSPDFPPRYIVCVGQKGKRPADDPDGERCGAIDEHGRIVVPFEDKKTRRIYFYDEGRFLFSDGEKGFIDASGKIVVHLSADYLSRPSEGLAAVYDGSHCGYIDLNGNLVIPYRWDICGRFKEGIAYVIDHIKADESESKGNVDEPERLYGFIGRDGKMITDMIYSYADEFYEGRASVQLSRHAPAELRESLGEGWGYIDREGNPVTKFEFQGAGRFKNERAAVSVFRFKLNGEDQFDAGYIDLHGNFIFPMTFGEAYSFNDSGYALITVCDETLYRKRKSNACKYGILRKDGTWQIEPGRFDLICELNEERANASMHDAWRGYVDENGDKVFAAEGGSTFVGGVALVSRKWLGKCHEHEFVDLSGRPIFPFGLLNLNYLNIYGDITHRDEAFFDKHGIFVAEIDSKKTEYREIVLHRERGIIWPPGWNERGAGEDVVCWYDEDFTDDMLVFPEKERLRWARAGRRR